MLFLAAVASAASTPALPAAAPQFQLPQSTYTALHKRHIPTVRWGFIASGIGVPVFFAGAAIAVAGAFADSGGLAMVAVNVAALGLAVNVVGGVVGMRSLTLYDRELKDLKAGRLDVHNLASWTPHCQVRARMHANGVGGTF